MKIYSIAIFTMVILLSAALVIAQPYFVSGAPDKAKAKPKVAIPENAVKVAPGIYKLAAVFSEGKLVEGFMIIDYKKEFAKPEGTPGKGPGATKCFAIFAKGAKWKTVEPWVVNPTNGKGLSDSFVKETLSAGIQKWEDAADGKVDGVSTKKDILGSGTITTDTLVADFVSPDGVNEVYFADIPRGIAVAVVWGTFNQDPPFNELIEWDQIYDNVDFDWSSSGQLGKQDFENVAQHELGHSVGMGHPNDSCTEETMYRFASFGETKKRDLHDGDIFGIKKLY